MPKKFKPRKIKSNLEFEFVQSVNGQIIIQAKEIKKMTNQEKELEDIKTEKILTFRKKQEKIATFLQSVILGMIENENG